MSDPRTDDAPATSETGVSGHTETINRPREAVYAFFRNFSNLAPVLHNVQAIEVKDETTSHWKVSGPDGTYEWDSKIVEDEENCRIAWVSTEGSDVKHEGVVTFRDAPPGRGTWITADIRYEPPYGMVGKAVAKLFQKEPSIQVRRDLKRLKALLEAGEIPTSSPPNPEPAS
ncbi:polyketide cyclase/dehydrase/lipid transport protein [Stakelama pacifica]|uniref:Polyketide cyclase/dehydrase/lipid transport protein n=2 Tax=Stakelama pacifica TaxID=517720 RepID=A0A4R6FZM9_9SPHN|nr:polyketide cyclase/dehydrase/lipid transport protein [Stakelama pacifica]GGO90924.1 cyclase [Stakelama pacifica]